MGRGIHGGRKQQRRADRHYAKYGTVDSNMVIYNDSVGKASAFEIANRAAKIKNDILRADAEDIEAVLRGEIKDGFILGTKCVLFYDECQACAVNEKLKKAVIAIHSCSKKSPEEVEKGVLDNYRFIALHGKGYSIALILVKED